MDLIAGVGHRFWRDLSGGPVWVDRWSLQRWPESIEIDDFSFGALAMVQRLQEARFERAAFVAAEPRGRQPGSIHWARYEDRQSPPDVVQAFISEAGGGVVALDALLIVGEYFKALPPETWVLEIEPYDEGWGDGLSVELDALFPVAERLLRSFAAGEILEPSAHCYDTQATPTSG